METPAGIKPGRHFNLNRRLEVIRPIDTILREWRAKKRRMGCVAAASWFCRRARTFKPERLIRYTENGELFYHVVVSDGNIRIDLAPYADGPKIERTYATWKDT